MVMLHPGEQAEVGRGPRLLVELPASHASAVGLAVEPTGRMTAVRHQRGRWILQGEPGASGRLAVVSASGGPMADVLSVRLSLPGGAPDAGSWELGDVPVDGRARVDLANVEVTAEGAWLIHSLVRPGVASGRSPQQRPSPTQSRLGPVPGGPVLPLPVVAGDPVTRDVVVAVDRSASLQWAFEGPALGQIVAGLLTARSRALTPESSLRWFTSGSTSDDIDGPREVDAHDRSAEELARALRPPLPSSGTRESSLLPRMAAGQLLVTVTDRWPDAGLVTACRERGVRLAAVLLGVPPDPSGWPADWRAQAQRCSDAAVPVLPVGDGSGAQPAVRDWGMQCLAASGPEPVEVRR